MENSDIQQLIEKTIPNSRVHVEGDGYHFVATIIADHFLGLSPVKRQQHVYAVMTPYITSGALHALSLHTYTSLEWKQQHG